MTSYTLLEEFVLLSLQDEGGHFEQIPEVHMACGIAGAALMDLALQGRIDSDINALWVVDPTPLGHPILDKVLADIAAETRRLDTKLWIKRLARRAHAMQQSAVASLCDKGVLHQVDSSFLWVMKDRLYPVADGQEQVEAKRRVIAVLLSNDIPSPRDVVLTALADDCLLFDRFFKPQQLEQVRSRIELISGMDLIGAQIVRSARTLNSEVRTVERNTIIAGLSGNIMEWYDFGIYGYFAATMGRLFFPTEDPATSLLAALGVFAIGFIGRPLGAVLLGYVGDSHSRRRATIHSVLLMGTATTLMAFLPTYAQIGVLAPLLLVLLRFAQGIAVGGEFTSSVVLMVEAALPSRRGFVGSFAGVGQLAGPLLASGVGAAVCWSLPDTAVSLWGWRFAFLLGLVIGIVVLILRSRLPAEEPISLPNPESTAPIVQIFKTERLAILKMIAILIPNGIVFNIFLVYLPIWLYQTQGVAISTGLALNCLAIGCGIAMNPLAGWVSDRFGRKPTLLVASIALTLCVLPIFWLMTGQSLLFITLAACGLATIDAFLRSGLSAYMVESFPREVRVSAVSLSHNVSVSLFGGTLPLVASFLLSRTGLVLAPAYYLWLGAIISLIILTVSIRGDSRYSREKNSPESAR